MSLMHLTVLLPTEILLDAVDVSKIVAEAQDGFFCLLPRHVDFVAALVELQKACGVDSIKMSDYGIRYEDLPKYVENAFDTMGGLFQFDPSALSRADVLAIFQASYR